MSARKRKPLVLWAAACDCEVRAGTASVYRGQAGKSLHWLNGAGPCSDCKKLGRVRKFEEVVRDGK